MAIQMVYDIETVPDVVAGRRLLGLQDASDKAVAEALFDRRAEQTGGTSRFLPHYLQRIVAISVVMATSDRVKVWSLGDLNAPEPEILLRFFEGIQRYTPTLVSWNGSGFDLPVIHYRSLLHGVAAPRYWETGQEDSEFKWNNYLSRYHQRHIDLMDVLAGYQTRANAPLEEIALMLGFPGKMGMHGSEVWDSYQAGNLREIREYCETDVLNTYLIYLRFQKIRGQLDVDGYEMAEARVKQFLEESEKPHFRAFLEMWEQNTLEPERLTGSTQMVVTDI